MRKFAKARPDRLIVQRVTAQIPWRNNQALLDKIKAHDLLIWYAQQNAIHELSRNILTLQTQAKRHLQIGNRYYSQHITLIKSFITTALNAFISQPLCTTATQNLHKK